MAKPAKITPAPIAKQEEQLEKVYVWELPIRVFHWVNAAAIVVLLITGYYIAFPFVGATTQGEAYYSFFMGWMRYIHFYAAFIFIINLIVRVYWFWAGNEYAKSRPWRLEFWKGLFETAKGYMFLPNKKKHYVGHNPMAEFSYWVFMGLGSILIILSGLYMLLEPQWGTTLSATVAWMPSIFGNSFSIRGLHHIAAVAILMFCIIHIYMAFREDWLSKNGAISSIFSGYKTETKHTHGDDDDDKHKKTDKFKKAN